MSKRKSRVLITGGAGRIGANVASYVPEQSFTVRVLDDLSTGGRKNLEGLNVEFAEGTILDYGVLQEAAGGVDSIVYLGAIPSVPRSVVNPRASHEANTADTLNRLEAGRAVGVDHVVVAPSSSVFGSNPNLPKSGFDWTRPISPYAVSKHAPYGYAIAYQYSYGMKTLAFRFDGDVPRLDSEQIALSSQAGMLSTYRHIDAPGDATIAGTSTVRATDT